MCVCVWGKLSSLTSQLLISTSARPTMCWWTMDTDTSSLSLFSAYTLLFHQASLLTPRLDYLTPCCFLSSPSCYRGKHLGDSMVVNNRETGQEPSPDEIRNKSVEEKTECAEDKRRIGRKERKHLNSHTLYPPSRPASPFGQRCALLSSHILPLSTSVLLQATELPAKV